MFSSVPDLDDRPGECGRKRPPSRCHSEPASSKRLRLVESDCNADDTSSLPPDGFSQFWKSQSQDVTMPDGFSQFWKSQESTQKFSQSQEAADKDASEPADKNFDVPSEKTFDEENVEIEESITKNKGTLKPEWLLRDDLTPDLGTEIETEDVDSFYGKNKELAPKSILTDSKIKKRV